LGWGKEGGRWVKLEEGVEAGEGRWGGSFVRWVERGAFRQGGQRRLRREGRSRWEKGLETQFWVELVVAMDAGWRGLRDSYAADYGATGAAWCDKISCTGRSVGGASEGLRYEGRTREEKDVADDVTGAR